MNLNLLLVAAIAIVTVTSCKYSVVELQAIDSLISSGRISEQDTISIDSFIITEGILEFEGGQTTRKFESCLIIAKGSTYQKVFKVTENPVFGGVKISITEKDMSPLDDWIEMEYAKIGDSSCDTLEMNREYAIFMIDNEDCYVPVRMNLDTVNRTSEIISGVSVTKGDWEDGGMGQEVTELYIRGMFADEETLKSLKMLSDLQDF